MVYAVGLQHLQEKADETDSGPRLEHMLQGSPLFELRLLYGGV